MKQEQQREITVLQEPTESMIKMVREAHGTIRIMFQELCEKIPDAIQNCAAFLVEQGSLSRGLVTSLSSEYVRQCETSQGTIVIVLAPTQAFFLLGSMGMHCANDIDSRKDMPVLVMVSQEHFGGGLRKSFGLLMWTENLPQKNIQEVGFLHRMVIENVQHQLSSDCLRLGVKPDHLVYLIKVYQNMNCSQEMTREYFEEHVMVHGAPFSVRVECCLRGKLIDSWESTMISVIEELKKPVLVGHFRVLTNFLNAIVIMDFPMTSSELKAASIGSA